MNFHIGKNNIFSIYYKNRQIFAWYDHYLIYFDLTEKISQDFPDWLYAERINLDNVEQCKNNSFNVSRMRRYLIEQPDKIEGYLFKEKENHNVVGFLWEMFPNGNELQYRIRKVDAFLFDVFVSENYRGKGICGHMLSYVFSCAEKSQIKLVALGVRRNNTSAIRAYLKAGGVIRRKRKFIQLFHRYNVPYYKI